MSCEMVGGPTMGGKYNNLEWFAWPWIDPPLIHPDDIDAWVVRNSDDGVRESVGYSCYIFRAALFIAWRKYLLFVHDGRKIRWS